MEYDEKFVDWYEALMSKKQEDTATPSATAGEKGRASPPTRNEDDLSLQNFVSTSDAANPGTSGYDIYIPNDEDGQEQIDPKLYAELLATNKHLAEQQQRLQQQLADVQAATQQSQGVDSGASPTSHSFYEPNQSEGESNTTQPSENRISATDEISSTFNQQTSQQSILELAISPPQGTVRLSSGVWPSQDDARASQDDADLTIGPRPSRYPHPSSRPLSYYNTHSQGSAGPPLSQSAYYQKFPPITPSYPPPAPSASYMQYAAPSQPQPQCPKL